MINFYSPGNYQKRYDFPIIIEGVQIKWFAQIHFIFEVTFWDGPPKTRKEAPIVKYAFTTLLKKCLWDVLTKNFGKISKLGATSFLSSLLFTICSYRENKPMKTYVIVTLKTWSWLSKINQQVFIYYSVTTTTTTLAIAS